MVVHLVATVIFLLNFFPRSKPGAGLSNTKVPGQLAPETSVDYKKVCCLHLGKCVQVHQDDETRNTIDIYQIVRAIVLGPQYNL